jgi:hypothetical protein
VNAFSSPVRESRVNKQLQGKRANVRVAAGSPKTTGGFSPFLAGAPKSESSLASALRRESLKARRNFDRCYLITNNDMKKWIS